MEIKVLGTGCAGCKALYETVKQAVAEEGWQATVVKEEDLVKIMSYNVMSLPALVVNGKVVAKGRRLSLEQVKELLKDSVGAEYWRGEDEDPAFVYGTQVSQSDGAWFFAVVRSGVGGVFRRDFPGCTGASASSSSHGRGRYRHLRPRSAFGTGVSDP